MLRIIQTIVVLGVVCLVGIVAVSGLRHGKVRLRGGMIIERRKKPFPFWASIAVSVLFCVVVIVAFAHSR